MSPSLFQAWGDDDDETENSKPFSGMDCRSMVCLSVYTFRRVDTPVEEGEVGGVNGDRPSTMC